MCSLIKGVLLYVRCLGWTKTTRATRWGKGQGTGSLDVFLSFFLKQEGEKGQGTGSFDVLKSPLYSDFLCFFNRKYTRALTFENLPGRGRWWRFLIIFFFVQQLQGDILMPTRKCSLIQSVEVEVFFFEVIFLKLFWYRIGRGRWWKDGWWRRGCGGGSFRWRRG